MEAQRQQPIPPSLLALAAMMQYIPTPCTAKRVIDDPFCARLHKRLRLQLPVGVDIAGGSPPSVAQAVSQYDGGNGWLAQLHAERLARRRQEGGPLPEAAPGSGSATASSAGRVLQDGRESSLPAATTSFPLSSVVLCGHGPGGRCLQCVGRSVQDVPMEVHAEFCAAYSGLLPQQASRSTAAASELAFPAFAALAACLAPEPGERLLHLGSGAGRAVAAWALMLPQSCASGVEPCPALHRAAAEAAARLRPEVRRRVFLHQGDILATQGDWHQASVILVSAADLDDATLARVADGLQGVLPGTRVVSVSRPLCAHEGRAPPNFSFERQAMYRAVSVGNSTVFIYRKL